MGASRIFSVAALAVALAGCVGARIVVPGELAATTDRLELTGIGGWSRGAFRLGGSEGWFRRSSSEERDSTGFEKQNFGTGAFEVRGPEFQGRLTGDCGYSEIENEFGALTVTTEHFTYRCRFMRDGRAIDASLVLDETPSRPGKIISGRTRTGFISMGGRTLKLRGVHDMVGGALPTSSPLGYRFEIEGRPVGSVDLNGSRKIIRAPLSGPDREIVLAASVALSILWDPEA